MIVLVTSVIACSEKKLSYSDTRSIFSRSERLQQTKKTIQSIRIYFPYDKIYILEGGYEDFSKDFCDFNNIQVLYLGKYRLIRYFVDSSNKSLGELSLLLGGIITGQIPYKESIIKISGRYTLTDGFSKNSFLDRSSFYRYSNQYAVSTKIYSLSKTWKYVVLLRLCFPIVLIGKSIEVAMFCALTIAPISYNSLEFLGIRGVDPTNNKPFFE